jgi:AcrR family transcriptional regulator
MELVRRAAGVSNGSLYHHFPTKAVLADALYADTLRDFHSALLVPISNRASAQAGVKGMIRAYVKWVEHNPERARLLHELRHSVDSTGGGDSVAANTESLSKMTRWIATRVQAGEMRAMPFPVFLALVFSPALALTPHWVREEMGVAPKVRAALEHAAWMSVAT